MMTTRQNDSCKRITVQGMRDNTCNRYVLYAVVSLFRNKTNLDDVFV